MNKTTIIIYAIIVGAAVLSSVFKKRKKTGTTNTNKPNPSFNNTNKPTTSTYKKPPVTQPKSLEDLLQNLLGEQKIQKPVEKKEVQQTIFADKQPQKFTSLETTETLEKQEVQYYSVDEELDYKDELMDYEKTTDHRVHGAGFDDVKVEMEESEGEWANIDWRKAIISAEILKRPEY